MEIDGSSLAVFLDHCLGKCLVCRLALKHVSCDVRLSSLVVLSKCVRKLFTFYVKSLFGIHVMQVKCTVFITLQLYA
jgi:hypothetical protein